MANANEKPDDESAVDPTAPPKRKRRFTDRTAEAIARGETGVGMTVPAAPPGTFALKS